MSATGSEPASSAGQYEFKAGENEKIGRLANAMYFVGGAAGVLALMNVAAGMVGFKMGGFNFQAAATWINGCVLLVIGAWLWKSANSFSLVVKTEGNDVAHLMDALDHLRYVFWLQRLVILIGIGIFVGLGIGLALGILPGK